jgi:hypothetical protein
LIFFVKGDMAHFLLHHENRPGITQVFARAGSADPVLSQGVTVATALDYKVVDIHVHVAPWDMLNPAAAAVMKAAQPNHAWLHELSTDPAKLVAYMDARNIEWLGLVNYLSPEVIGYTEAVNDFSASFAAHYPHRFIPFGGVDPRRTSDMIAQMDHLLGELRLRAVKIHPPPPVVQRKRLSV